MLNYFKFKDENKMWIKITREERFFCSELYHDIKKDINGFIKFLNENCNVKLDENSYWEIGYEVCFYRDFLKAKGNSIKKFNNDNLDKNPKAIRFPPKRTFDLCLFSNEKIVIIEAKADQKFKDRQLKDLREDVTIYLPEILKNSLTKIQVDAVLLSSKKDQSILTGFENKRIYWDQLAEFYVNETYSRADILGNKNINK